MEDRLWAWVPERTRVRGPDGVTSARKGYRVKVYRVHNVDDHDHGPNEPCRVSCAPGATAYVSWVDGKAHWCEAKLDLINREDPRWYRRK